jgi:hypothetical protein
MGMATGSVGRTSYQAKYCGVVAVACAVPTWMRSVFSQPSMPIHVAEYSGVEDG